jgi:hypothetical protein
MRAKGLSASRIREAHLVVSAIFNEASRDKMIAESPCFPIELPEVVIEKDFIQPTHAQRAGQGVVLVEQLTDSAAKASWRLVQRGRPALGPVRGHRARRVEGAQKRLQR